MPILYILRGIPGSGKSTLAKKLVKPSCHFEADMFHMEGLAYNFKPENVKLAHEWCFDSVLEKMFEFEDIAVSNTFTQRWEYQNYMNLAVECGYDLMIIECHGEWDNIHGVPGEVLDRMKSRWEPHRMSQP